MGYVNRVECAPTRSLGDIQDSPIRLENRIIDIGNARRAGNAKDVVVSIIALELAGCGRRFSQGEIVVQAHLLHEQRRGKQGNDLCTVYNIKSV
jgi:hypothetical protein